MGRTHEKKTKAGQPPQKRRPRRLTTSSTPPLPSPSTSPIHRSLRQAYNLQPRSALYDCCAHFWFMSCALCQEARELKIRGATPERPVFNPGARARILQRPGIQHLYPGFPVRDQAVELLAPAQVVAPAQATMDLEQPANGIPAPQFADPEKPWKK